MADQQGPEHFSKNLGFILDGLIDKVTRLQREVSTEVDAIRRLAADLAPRDAAPPWSPPQASTPGLPPLPEEPEPDDEADGRVPVAIQDRRGTKRRESKLRIMPEKQTYTISAGEGNELQLRRVLALRDTWKSAATCDLLSVRSLQSSDAASDVLSAVAEVARRVSATAGHRFSFTINPFSHFRSAWDLVGLTTLLCDAVLLPVSVAWDIEIMPGMLWFEAVYWAATIGVNFVTSFYRDGLLVVSNVAIAKEYARSWLLFDVFLVILDCIILFGAAIPAMRIVRNTRYFRLIRLLRLWSMSRVSSYLEDMFDASSAMPLIMCLAGAKIFSRILLCAHVVACMWFFVGRLSQESDHPSWLDAGGIVDLRPHAQYVHALHYVLAQFTPAGVGIQPENLFERVFTVAFILLSIFVMGSSISLLTSTLTQLGNMQRGIRDKRRQAQRYLRHRSIPLELTMRTMYFVKNSLKMHHESPPAPHLLSPALKDEIETAYRCQYLTAYPLFAHLAALSIENNSLLAKLSRACVSHDHIPAEVVFKSNTPAEHMYITLRGAYVQGRRREIDVEAEQTYTGCHYFADACLFSLVSHSSTLTALTPGETLSLSSSAFAAVVEEERTIYNNVCQYAAAYIRSIGLLDWDDIHGRPQVLDYQPRELAAAACLRPRSSNERRPSVDLDEDETDCGAIRAFVKQVVAGGLSEEDIISAVPRVFLEFSESAGVYSSLCEDEERRRCMASVISAFMLVRDRYDDFVQLQDPGARMTRPVWEELQAIVRWIGLDVGDLEVTVVFLAIRGIGRIQQLARLLAADCGEQAVVRHIMETNVEILPSVQQLSGPRRRQLGELVLNQGKLSFAALVQGENNPSALEELKETAVDSGGESLKTFLFSSIAIMCGIEGRKSIRGSLFMNEGNGRIVLYASQCLRMLEDADPCGAYWGYMANRARQFSLPTRRLEDLAFARLICINRVLSSRDLRPVQMAWRRLNPAERNILTESLVADGISEHAIMFSYLPIYYKHARDNPCVGLYRALVVQAELLDRLRADVVSDSASGRTTRVNVSELAEFALHAKSSFEFERVPEQLVLSPTGLRRWAIRVEGGHESMNISKQFPSLIHTVNQIARVQNSGQVSFGFC